MKQLLLLIVIFLLLFWLLFGCGKDTPPNVDQQPPATDPARYSGSWTGTLTVTELNPTVCYWSGGPAEITQNWTVTGDSVKVEEIAKDNTGIYTDHWLGTIRNDTLEMVSKRDINCFGVFNSIQIVVRSRISSLADKYSIQTSANYTPCPPDCRFV